ncbi:CynX/NimT family MFS transporter [Chloroflexota bacterium]
MLGLVYVCVLSFAIAMQSVPPVLSLIMDELRLSHAQGGLLMSLFAVPGIVIAIPAGMLADRYSQKTIGIVSLVLIVTGMTVFASGNSFLMLGLGRVVSGAGAITLIVLASMVLAQWFAGRELGVAMGVFNTGMPLGTILSFNLLSRLGERLGWQASAWFGAGLSLVVLVIFILLFTPAPRSSKGKSLPPEGFFQGIRLSGKSIWIMGVAWLFFNASALSMFTFTPSFLTSTGLTIAGAGFLVSIVMWPSPLVSPLVGYVTDRIGYKRLMIAIGGMAMTILMVLLPTAIDWMVWLLLLMGISQGIVPTPVMALAPEVTPPERLGLGFGIIMTCSFLGISAGPASTGWFRDFTGSYQASYALMSGFAFMIVVAMFILSRMRNKTPPDIHGNE